jgi:hypothetical protein
VNGSFHDGVGDAMFDEATNRYNTELAAFIRSTPR